MNREWNRFENRQISWLEFSKLKSIPFVFSGLTVKDHKESLFTSKVFWKDKFKKFLNRQAGYVDGIVIPKQIHQNKVVSIKKSHKFNPRKKLQADGILTNKVGLFLTIQVADCIPIYIVDPKRKVVGLIHAGWRGSLLQIAKEAIDEARKSFGCLPKGLQVFLGPAIGKCCYKVAPDVAILFPARFVNYKSVAKPKLDLIGLNQAQLIESGVKKKNILLAGKCTYCGPSFLCSYRRDRNKKGRMLAFIGIK
jgi:YfiH family protein